MPCRLVPHFRRRSRHLGKHKALTSLVIASSASHRPWMRGYQEELRHPFLRTKPLPNEKSSLDHNKIRCLDIFLFKKIKENGVSPSQGPKAIWPWGALVGMEVIRPEGAWMRRETWGQETSMAVAGEADGGWEGGRAHHSPLYWPLSPGVRSSVQPNGRGHTGRGLLCFWLCWGSLFRFSLWLFFES